MDTARFENLPEVLTVSEAAELLRIGRNAAYEAVRCGEIPSVRIGRRILVPRAGLEQLLAGVQSPCGPTALRGPRSPAEE